MPQLGSWMTCCLKMLARDLVNVAMHPASHNCPTERRLPDAKDGKR